MLALRPKRTPLGLTRNTCPLAERRPKISEGLLPRTRLSAMAEALGCAKLTASVLPIEKLCQLRMAFWVAWLICRLEAVGCEMVAWPAATSPPVGRAKLLWGAAIRAPATATARAVGRVFNRYL